MCIEIAVKKPKNKKVAYIVEFLKEIQVWSTLRHPNLVQFLGFSINHINDDITILMEKINGKNLKQFLENSKISNSSSYKKHIVTQLITIIKFLHNCDPPVIYRDLKPENILIDCIYNIKLTDFGLSKYFCESEDGNYSMTGNTGTLRYMAPEVYLSQKYNLNVDVYSLGLIMYYLFSNEVPFNNYTPDKMDNYFRSEDLMFNTEKIRYLTLRSIINKCICKDPTKRININELTEKWNNECEVKTQNKCIIS